MAAAIDYGEKDARSKEKPQSRSRAYVDAKIPVPYVELEAGDYLMNMLMEVGPALNDPMGGTVPISWQELNSYIQLTVGSVERWEAVLLVEMSQAYCRGLREGTNPLSIMPMERKQG